MIDHLSVPVRDVEVTMKRWTKALAPLGYEVVMAFTRAEVPQLPHERTAGLGARGKPDVWLRPAKGAIDPLHVAIRAEHRRQVDEFHAAALAVGMVDDGAPGLRQHYHPHYYGAFVRDGDGHSLEVVCHAPVPDEKASAPKKPKRAAKKKPARR